MTDKEKLALARARAHTSIVEGMLKAAEQDDGCDADDEAIAIIDALLKSDDRWAIRALVADADAAEPELALGGNR